MVERGEGGSLVGTSSLAAIEGQPRGQHYAATKGGMVSMVKALAVELARHGIRANTVLPGWIETPLAEPLLQWDRFKEKVLPRVPAGRWGTPDDFAGIAVFLSSAASDFVTGAEIAVDGGYSSQG
jgi:NAD(P)-dependent dehydrogenase (short-subunit alcohol dehydrogenase family)